MLGLDQRSWGFLTPSYAGSGNPQLRWVKKPKFSYVSGRFFCFSSFARKNKKPARDLTKLGKPDPSYAESTLHSSAMLGQNLTSFDGDGAGGKLPKLLALA